MKIAVIGGDMRQVKLAEFLAKDGNEVMVYALDKVELNQKVTKASSIGEAVENADCVILPLPVTSIEDVLNAPLSRRVLTVDEIVSLIMPGQMVFAGKIDEKTQKSILTHGIQAYDYLEREEFAILNAIATAEGAIQIIMEETDITLSGARCLVVGYGRIGRTLSSRLNGLNADVTVSARKCSDIAWIKSSGYKALNTEKLEGKLSDFDVIVNTVPAGILKKKRLEEIGKNCLCLDLASKPGGVDFSEASKLGLKTIWALSLPGEVAAASSGKAIMETIYNIISEQE